MKQFKILQAQYLKNLILIILFLIFSLVLGIIKKSTIEPIQSINNIKLVSNQEKIKNYSLPTVLYIWATWCTICNANSYIININYKIADFLNVHFISLEEGENIDLLKNIIKERSINYPIGILNENLSLNLKISEYPTFIFLDNYNHIKLKDSGIVNPISFFIRLIYIKYF